MEKDQEQKFICKVCGKSFPSGMSLGGHMRSHLVKKSSKKPKVHSSKLAYVDNGDDDDDNEDDCVLTQYKKRSLKVSTDENSTAMYVNETRCKKVFKKPKVQSRKLPFVDNDDDDDNDDGYVLSEYSKRRPLKVLTDENSPVVYENVTKCKECGKEFPSVRSLCGHMRWHTVKKTSEKDYVCKKCGKGFDSMRALFGHMTHHSRKSTVLNEPAYSLSDSEGKVAENMYSSSYDIDCDETEQAAIILMMLSRGMIQTGSSNLVLEKSEDMRILHSVDILEKKKKKMNRRKKLGTWGSCSSFMFVKEKPEFDDLDDSFSSGDEKKVEVSDEVENEFSGFVIKNRKRKRVQPGENVKKHEGDKNSVGIKSKGVKKSKRFVCWICSKAFHTRKGLGGHKKAHKYDDFENKSQERVTMNQENDDKDNVFDLNFCVDAEEKANVDLELKPWCVEIDHKHEPLLISNCV